MILSLRHSRRLPLPPDDPIRRHTPPPSPVARSRASDPEASAGDVQLAAADAHLTFEDLALPPYIVDALRSREIRQPSPVQLAALPVARRGGDLIAQAKSGTGKTLVFCVVAVERALGMKNGPVVLILVPTRELANQIFEVLGMLTGRLDVTAARLIGGVPRREDERKLLERPGVVVGTPGRVLAMMKKGALDGAAVSLLVLDEADRLIDGSMGDTVPRVCKFLGARKQTLAFSATFPGRLERLLKKVMRSPSHVQMCKERDGERERHGERGVHRKAVLVAVRQRKTLVEGNSTALRLKRKMERLASYLERNPFSFCIVFMNDKKKGEEIVGELEKAGFLSTYINADIAQWKRLAIMERVKSGKVQVLLSTDLLARGVDIDCCDLVVHLDVPKDSATYLHRVGRAGRFGRMGLSLVIYSEEDDGADLRNLETDLGFQLEQQAVDAGDTDPQVIPVKTAKDAGVQASSDKGEISALGVSSERCSEEGPAKRQSENMLEKSIDENQEPAGVFGDRQVAHPDGVMQIDGTSNEAGGMGEQNDTAQMDVEIPYDTECVDTDREPQPSPHQACNGSKIGANSRMQANGAVWEENMSSASNFDKAWEKFAQEAYDKGYKEAYEQGFRMAMQLRARIEGHHKT